ncbi:MAG: TrmB family transcriptional regulator [Actinomycetota bacterium]
MEELQRRVAALGLSDIEAAVYVALLRGGELGAPAVAEDAGASRTAAYAALRALADHGLVEAGAGYGSRFRAVPPERALPTLVDREREAARERIEAQERMAKELVQELGQLVDEAAPSGDGHVVEVIRNRRAMQERFDRLQLEAEHEIATVVKAPIVTTGDPNPAQDVVLGRGVRVRGLYERAILDHADIRPHLEAWAAGGEEMRVHPGELPLKFSLIDGRTALLPLETPDERSPFTTLIVRHRALGAGLRALYEYLWVEAEPLEAHQ